MRGRVRGRGVMIGSGEFREMIRQRGNRSQHGSWCGDVMMPVDRSTGRRPLLCRCEPQRPCTPPENCPVVHTGSISNWTVIWVFFLITGASPYSMGPASQGTPTPMMSPAPAGGQDSMGYNMNLNGGDYSSSMSGSQPPYSDSALGYDPMHQ